MRLESRASTPAGGAGREPARVLDLGRMSLRDLVHAFVRHPAVQSYVALGLLSAAVSVAYADGAIAPIAAAIATILLYPLVEYVLHRFVLHARWMYKSRWTAKLWKRIHFDHHQDPHRLDVLFGALSTTLPVVLAVAAPVGWAIGGFPSAAAAVAAGFFVLCVYEFCHCIQHLNWRPSNPYLRRVKRLHLNHHFHNETANFGITSFFIDRWVGSLYEDAKEKPASPTTFDLGYDAAEARAYPWVAELTGGPPRSRPPRAGE
jgi:sterol desaturase/sphingolipid hydroxylase (fatty acid hydroxylase superfamily)